MKDKIAKLIDLKSILTLSLVLTLEILVLGYFFMNNGTIEEKLFLLFSNIVTNCFTYYFAKAKSSGEGSNNE